MRFADDKRNVTEKFKLVLRRVENIVGKGGNVGSQKSFPSNSIKCKVHHLSFLRQNDAFGRVENIVGKGGNVGSPQSFPT